GVVLTTTGTGIGSPSTVKLSVPVARRGKFSTRSSQLDEDSSPQAATLNAIMPQHRANTLYFMTSFMRTAILAFRRLVISRTIFTPSHSTQRADCRVERVKNSC